LRPHLRRGEISCARIFDFGDLVHGGHTFIAFAVRRGCMLRLRRTIQLKIKPAGQHSETLVGSWPVGGDLGWDREEKGGLCMQPVRPLCRYCSISVTINVAIRQQRYYTGSLYDLPSSQVLWFALTESLPINIGTGGCPFFPLSGNGFDSMRTPPSMRVWPARFAMAA